MSGDEDADIATILASSADTATAAGATVNATRGLITLHGNNVSNFSWIFCCTLWWDTTQAALAAASTNTGGVYGIGLVMSGL